MVYERLLVARWDSSGTSDCAEISGRGECRCSVRRHFRAIASNINYSFLYRARNALPGRLRITGRTLIQVVDVASLNSTFALDDSCDSRSSSSGVVRDRGRLRLLNLGTQDRRGGDIQDRINVDQLWSSGSKGKKAGDGEGVTHCEMVVAETVNMKTRRWTPFMPAVQGDLIS